MRGLYNFNHYEFTIVLESKLLNNNSHLTCFAGFLPAERVRVVLCKRGRGARCGGECDKGPPYHHD